MYDAVDPLLNPVLIFLNLVYPLPNPKLTSASFDSNNNILLQGMLERVGTYLSHQNFCDGVNLALGKVASASSAHEDHTAGEAIDGMLTEKTCFWSAPDVNHW